MEIGTRSSNLHLSQCNTHQSLVTPFAQRSTSRPRRLFACSATSKRTVDQTAHCSRRDLLFSVAGLAYICGSQAQAAETSIVAAADQNGPPKNYVKFARKLLASLRDAIEVDLSPAKELEVRRKADPAKALVKEWVANWRDSRAVAGEPSYTEISESLQLLGNFYLQKGQRSRLPEKLGTEILRHLDAASSALPASA